MQSIVQMSVMGPVGRSTSSGWRGGRAARVSATTRAPRRASLRVVRVVALSTIK
jgi:hypothetical protein